jgi:hypothetical protein
MDEDKEKEQQDFFLLYILQDYDSYIQCPLCLLDTSNIYKHHQKEHADRPNPHKEPTKSACPECGVQYKNMPAHLTKKHAKPYFNMQKKPVYKFEFINWCERNIRNTRLGVLKYLGDIIITFNGVKLPLRTFLTVMRLKQLSVLKMPVPKNLKAACKRELGLQSFKRTWPIIECTDIESLFALLKIGSSDNKSRNNF